MKKTALLLSLLLFALVCPKLVQDVSAQDPMMCLKCHEDVVSVERYAGSVHGQHACTSCHVEVVDLDRHIHGEQSIEPVHCVRCHSKETKEHYASVHMLADISCASCHSSIHEEVSWMVDKWRVVQVCSRCHESDHYVFSIHGQAVKRGNHDSAACHDCHGLHRIEPLGDPTTQAYTDFHTRACLTCHSDREMMERNGIFTLAVKTYLESYHGKSYRLGSGQSVAGCSDCHTSHEVLPSSQPASSVNPKSLVVTCSRCHPKATTLFTKFYVHGDPKDRNHYPILYWTYVAMTSLVVGVFAVFWLHTLLWLFRGFAENRQKRKAWAEGGFEPVPDGHRRYRRFRGRHIFLHLVVIVSFLGLSLTGLPLKFSDENWARAMMSFFGGVHFAGLIHRGCAILTFYYFFAALVMSIDFLFFKRDIKGNWLQRLFGPESLMPNLKDLKDVIGMFKWFFFKGPKPHFERWTYWEKFDFLAVFWGMFAIGGSGLLLWFPELFGRFLPGWVFNVATIIHSDEALLATGFIFTVHFFNTHARPEKFPMDFVIFNGEITKEEFMEERTAQWRRYEEAGVTEDYEVSKPSGILYDFLLKGFGFLAVFTGLTLAFLMLMAFLRG